MLSARREMALMDHPCEDPDLRFPVLDNRDKEIGTRTANANRNLLRLHLAMKTLWQSAVRREAEEGFTYNFVLFVRDDALWLSDFRLKPFASRLSQGYVFVPRCDDRDPPMERRELNDHFVVAGRASVDIHGNYYSNLFRLDLMKCMDRLSPQLTMNGSRGCNSAGTISALG